MSKEFMSFDHGTDQMKLFLSGTVIELRPIELHHKANGTIKNGPSFLFVLKGPDEGPDVSFVAQVSLEMLNEGLNNIGYNIARAEFTNADKTALVQAAENAEELFLAFDTIGEVHGTKKTYTPERLKEKFHQLRELVEAETPFHAVPWNNLTRAHGIRNKVMEILWYEKRKI